MKPFYAMVNGEKPRFGWCGNCLQPNQGRTARSATCSGCNRPPTQCDCRDKRRAELLRQEWSAA